MSFIIKIICNNSCLKITSFRPFLQRKNGRFQALFERFTFLFGSLKSFMICLKIMFSPSRREEKNPFSPAERKIRILHKTLFYDHLRPNFELLKALLIVVKELEWSWASALKRDEKMYFFRTRYEKYCILLRREVPFSFSYQKQKTSWSETSFFRPSCVKYYWWPLYRIDLKFTRDEILSISMKSYEVFSFCLINIFGNKQIEITRPHTRFQKDNFKPRSKLIWQRNRKYRSLCFFRVSFVCWKIFCSQFFF